MHVSAVVYGGQKKSLDSLELELQVIVNNPLLVLGTQLESSGREAKGLNH